jgi:hypothetical protein
MNRLLDPLYVFNVNQMPGSRRGRKEISPGIQRWEIFAPKGLQDSAQGFNPGNPEINGSP